MPAASPSRSAAMAAADILFILFTKMLKNGPKADLQRRGIYDLLVSLGGDRKLRKKEGGAGREKFLGLI